MSPASAARHGNLFGNSVQRNRNIIDRLADTPATTQSPWRSADLVLDSHPHYGRFGDAVWTFGKQAPNHSAKRCDVHWSVGPDQAWPTHTWAAIGRDLGMALLGRQRERSAPTAGARKPVSVHRMLTILSLVARWAHDNGHGTPDQWDETIGSILVRDARNDLLPRRIATRSTSDASLRSYLDVFAELWLNRGSIVHGPSAVPWPNSATVSPTEMLSGGARPTLMPAVSTEVIDPTVWWALVRFALRFVVVYSPDLLPAWQTYVERSRDRPRGNIGKPNLGPQTLARFEAFAADPSSRVPVNADNTVNRWQLGPRIGVTDMAWHDRNQYADQCRAVIANMVEEGRTTRFWFGPVSEVLRPDGTRGTWTDALDVNNLPTLMGRLTDACYIIISALGALRDSETQGLRRGCVTISEGGLALSGEIIKGNAIPEVAVWWIDPLVATCIKILEDLTAVMNVSDLEHGSRVPSDRLFWRLGAGPGAARAGLGPGSAVLKQTIEWINTNASAFDLPRANDDPDGPAIPYGVTPHQLRTTFAAVAAMEPDGPLGVAAQLHDTFTVAAGYMANQDRKWLDVHRAHRDQITVARLRRYLDGARDNLTGPGADGLRADLHVATDDAAALTDENEDYEGLVDRLLLAAGRSVGTSNLSHCRGRVADARCATIFGGIAPDEAFSPNFEADVCFGAEASDDCRNVVYDPPDHLPVWDLALSAYRAELVALPQGRHTAQVELERLIKAAESRISDMEHACLLRPQTVLSRLLRELERYLDYLRFDADIPGSAAQYRPLYLATQNRIAWLREKIPKEQRPDWALPVINHSMEQQ